MVQLRKLYAIFKLQSDRLLEEGMFLDILYMLLTVILLLAGFAGCVLPVLPGPILCFCALLVAQLTSWVDFPTSTLVIFAGLAVEVLLIDNIVPIWGTKKLGGTKAGMWGSTIGLLVAVFVLPLLGIVMGPFGLFGIILGPLLGAWIGEKLGGTADDIAIRAALGSFVGFLAGTFLKLMLCVANVIWLLLQFWSPSEI